MAWTGPRGVLVVPVNYTISDGALWFRTTPDRRGRRDTTEGWVAVEVDTLDPDDAGGLERGGARSGRAGRGPGRARPARGSSGVAPGLRTAYARVEPGEVTGRRLLPGA